MLVHVKFKQLSTKVETVLNWLQEQEGNLFRANVIEDLPGGRTPVPFVGMPLINMLTGDGGQPAPACCYASHYRIGHFQLLDKELKKG